MLTAENHCILTPCSPLARSLRRGIPTRNTSFSPFSGRTRYVAPISATGNLKACCICSCAEAPWPGPLPNNRWSSIMGRQNCFARCDCSLQMAKQSATLSSSNFVQCLWINRRDTSCNSTSLGGTYRLAAAGICRVRAALNKSGIPKEVVKAIV